jgi:hypothetical protein
VSEPLIFIRFSSHSSRSYALRALDRKPQGYWSLKRKTGPGGVYAVTEAEIAILRQSRYVHFTRVRGPHDDLLECWSD